MVVYRKNSGKKLDPSGHSKAVSEILFSPENGSGKAVVHITELGPGGGLDTEEVHDCSDQIFHILDGEIVAYSHGKEVGKLGRGDALLVPEGDPHCLKNESDSACILYVITTPPLES